MPNYHPGTNIEVGYNVLLIVLDDMGREQLGQYGLADPAAAGYPATPNIDFLAANGCIFDHFYTTAFCSPTRAGVMTGRMAARTGIGDIIESDEDQPLFAGEFILPELIKEQSHGGVVCGAIGKWHLGNAQNGGINSPNEAGFDYFCGTTRNLVIETTAANAWYFFDYECQGEQFYNEGTYATTWVADKAIDWIAAQTDKQWFAFVSFHAPHEPFHRPPTNLFDTVTWNCPLVQPPAQTGAGVLPYFKAAVEALDHEIGRMLDSIPSSVRDRTTVILMSDNGTVGTCLANEEWHGDYGGGVMEFNHGKRTCYDLGIRCPLIVHGPSVEEGTGRRISGLANALDLYLTIPKLLNLPDPEENFERRDVTVDAVDFSNCIQTNTPLTSRTSLISEIFQPNGANAGTVGGHRAVLGKRWKLYNKTGAWATQSTREFYDRLIDPRELTNLIPGGVLTSLTTAQRDAYNELAALGDDFYAEVALTV